MNVTRLLAAAAALASLPALAQDAARGARLYAETGRLTGKPVASCVACHSDIGTLRELLRNRRGQCDDAAALARWIGAVVDGAQPGAANAKLQFRGVLKAGDLRDLAAYIACTKQAAARPPELAAASSP